jgi:protein-S-isoprenylcysteine O-methyltransferase Ste14
MKDWKLELGNILFKYRSFTPVPLIVLVFVIFKPANLGEKNIFINLCGLILSLCGEFIRVIAVGYAHSGTSGRESFLKADALNTTGIYSLVRNPLYIGNFLIFSGLLVVFANIWAEVVVAVFLIVQYYFIILSEEDFLRKGYGKVYEDYCGRVRRVIPVFMKYEKASNPFNLRKVIFKESDSVFNLLVMYLLVIVYKEWVFSGTISHPFMFIIPGVVFIISYIMVKIVKKKRKA